MGTYRNRNRQKRQASIQQQRCRVVSLFPDLKTLPPFGGSFRVRIGVIGGVENLLVLLLRVPDYSSKVI